MKPAVFITDGEQRAALAAARSLGVAGYPVDVSSVRGRSLTGASRYVRAEWKVPDPLADPRAYIETLTELCRRQGTAVLLPITEPSLLAVLAARDEFSGVRIPFPPLDIFRAISDKQALSEAAAGLGLAVPAQRVLGGPGDFDTSGPGLRFPVVLKPARSVGEADGRRAKVGVRYAANESTLNAQCKRLPPQAFPLLVQQRIIGPGVGVFLLLWNSERLAIFCHRRIREKPPSGGVSVYCESIAPDEALVDASERLLREFGWRDGVAMVEYKIDAETGTAYLMEVNARFWGSLQLAIDAGVNFPLLLVEQALGMNQRRTERYRIGVRNRWWWGDVDHLLARLRRSSDELALPPGSPGRVKSVLEFIRPSWRHSRIETFRFADPRPFVRETADWFRSAAG